MPAFQQLRRERMAESLRLLYVALTRARHRCFVVWGGLRNHRSSALGYLLHGREQSPFAELSIDPLCPQLPLLKDEQMLGDIEQLVVEADGTVGLRTLLLHDREAPRVQEPERGLTLSCRAVPRVVDRSWTVSSFSQLTASAAPANHSASNHRLAHSSGADFSGADRNRIDHSEGRDRDQTGAAALVSPVEQGELVTLLHFPRGAKAGNFFHDLFEHLDFDASDSVREQLVRQKLSAHGYAADEHQAAICQGLREQLATKLKTGRGGFCLGDIGRGQRLDELGFHVPIATALRQSAKPIGRQLELCFGPPAGRQQGLLTRRELAGVFADHPSAELRSDYAERVARLGFAPLAGFLKGFIDLVFRKGGRWYLADYKSNHLGDVLSAYDSERLAEAMAHSHYYLQYHLYALALHRHLTARLPGYRYEKHFGGVYYLFIKGMKPSSRRAPTVAAGRGVFFERPPLRRIEALSALLDHPPPSHPLGHPPRQAQRRKARRRKAQRRAKR